MRSRLLSLLTAGALAMSALLVPSLAQGDEPEPGASTDVQPGAVAADNPVSQRQASISGTVTWPDGFAPDSDAGDSGASLVKVHSYPVATNAEGEVTHLEDFDRAGVVASDGSYTIDHIDSGAQYLVFVDASDFSPVGLLSTSASGYATVLNSDERAETTNEYGAAAMYSLAQQFLPYSTAVTLVDLRDMPYDADVQDVDISMKTGSTISGTVRTPDGVGYHYEATERFHSVTCLPVGEDGKRDGVADQFTARVYQGGEYTCLGEPGQRYVAYADFQEYLLHADVSGYPLAWLGGMVGPESQLPNSDATVVTAPAAGGSLSGQDITLVEGVTLTGKVTGVAGDGVAVVACQVVHGDVPNCAAAGASELFEPGWERPDGSYVSADGRYVITQQVPGATYIVYAMSRSTITWFGGYVGYPTAYDSTGITPISTGGAGTSVANIDISLAYPTVITGTVSPTSGLEGAQVYACPVFDHEGQEQYLNVFRDAWGGPSPMHPWCEQANVSAGHYSMQISPGVEYVVIGQSAGLTDAWHGGYGADAGMHGRLTEGGSDRAVVPSSPLVRRVSGASGETIGNVNIVFTDPVSVVFDDGTDSTTVASAVGSTPPWPVDPVQEGYVFGGWYTQPDGQGTRVTVDTVLDGDVTLYAQWTPDTVEPPVPTAPSLSLETAVVVQGESFVATGTGFEPGESVEVRVRSGQDGEVTAVGTYTADENGVLTVTVPTDDTMPDGVYAVLFVGALSGELGSNFTVTTPVEPTPPTDGDTPAAPTTPTVPTAPPLGTGPVWTGPASPGAPVLPVIDQATSTVISGTAEPGVTLTLTYLKADGTTGSVDVPVAADGTWSVKTPSDAVTGKVTVSVKGADSSTASATRDLSIPTITVTTGGTVLMAGPSDSAGLMTLLVGLALVAMGVGTLKLRKRV